MTGHGLTRSHLQALRAAGFKRFTARDEFGRSISWHKHVEGIEISIHFIDRWIVSMTRYSPSRSVTAQGFASLDEAMLALPALSMSLVMLCAALDVDVRETAPIPRGQA